MGGTVSILQTYGRKLDQWIGILIREQNMARCRTRDISLKIKCIFPCIFQGQKSAEPHSDLFSFSAHSATLFSINLTLTLVIFAGPIVQLLRDWSIGRMTLQPRADERESNSTQDRSFFARRTLSVYVKKQWESARTPKRPSENKREISNIACK